jgi:hypothetical protein
MINKPVLVLLSCQSLKDLGNGFSGLFLADFHIKLRYEMLDPSQNVGVQFKFHFLTVYDSGESCLILQKKLLLLKSL